MPRLRALPCLVLLLSVLAPAAPARAAGDWDGVSERIASSMVPLQQPDGSLEDYLSAQAQPYAEAMVGYGLLLRGTRTGDRTAIDAGLRAVSQTVQPDVRGGPLLHSVFKQLAVAAAYRLASERLAGDPAFESRRASWAGWLQQVRPVLLTPQGRGASNKHLVEAVADLELLRSGIPAGEPGTVLADPAGTLARVRALVDARWPAVVRGQERRGPLGRMAVASDGPTHPLAYHALSLAMLDRAIALLGPQGTTAARAARRSMARASWTLTAPDGDLAYWGRSHEQSWALALTAAGAGALAADGAGGAARAGALRARLAERIARVHGFGRYGVWIVPALRTTPVEGRAAMDDYAANGVYNGLTLVGAEWALAAPPAAVTSAGRLAADGNTAWRVGRGLGSFAVARRGDVWLAVRMRGGFGRHLGDPRYGFGLMAAKRWTGSAWRDVVPAPPRRLGGEDAPGPWLVLPGGRRAAAYGTRIAVRRDGAVVVLGGFRTASGRVVRRGVHFLYAPARRGVAVSFRVRARDEIEVAEFRSPARAQRAVDLRLRPERGRRRTMSGAIEVRGGFASATLGPVVRVGGRVRAARAGTLTWTPR